MLELLAKVLAAISIVSFMALILHTQHTNSPTNTFTPLPIRTATPAIQIPPKSTTVDIVSRPIEDKSTSPPLIATRKTPFNGIDFHFVHIPKCGGTSMTAILRQMACNIDTTRNEDCCTNPGFCEHNDGRRCAAIKGCVNHLPQTEWLFRPPPSITIIRDPTSRLLSAWFYRGHSPNLDFFQVRPEFKEIKLGLRPKVVFEEYVEMPEYQNIQTRMLGANSFPYKNITITDAVFARALKALDAFFFVGLQEAYYISVKMLLREVHMETVIEAPVIRERHQKPSPEKLRLKSNEALMQRVKDVNSYDYKLYAAGLLKFCAMVAKYPDLVEELKSTTKVKCDNLR